MFATDRGVNRLNLLKAALAVSELKCWVKTERSNSINPQFDDLPAAPLEAGLTPITDISGRSAFGQEQSLKLAGLAGMQRLDAKII